MSDPINQNEVINLEQIKPQPLTLSTISLVFGILSFIMIPFCGLVSLVTGIIALVKINSSKGLLLGKGKAITGICLGIWSVLRMPVLAILAAMLLPALSKAKLGARDAFCSSNLKCIGLGVLQFADDHNNMTPTSTEELRKYVGDDEVMHCPLCLTSKYDLLPSAKGVDLSQMQNPSKTPIAICTNHSGVDIVLYADGHVETQPKKQE